MWMYMTFADAHGLLHKEAMWLPVCCLRTRPTLSCLDGGWSAAFARVMEYLFLEDGLPATGICMPGIDDGRSSLWFFEFGYFLADCDAIKYTLCAKGASGSAPCPKCANVCNFGDKSLVQWDTTGTIVDIGCPDPGRVVQRNSQDLWRWADRLR